MAYARIENGNVVEFPLFEGEIKRRFPNTSFSSDFEPPSGYVNVVNAIAPSVDYTKNIKQVTPALIDGQWTVQWSISDASAEEIQQRQDSEANSVRSNRNARLAACDWTQLPDAPVDKTAWATYRQQLRDISSQEGFPWTIIWPDEP